MIKAKKPKNLHSIEPLKEEKSLMDNYLEGKMKSIQDIELEMYVDFQKCKECINLSPPKKLKKCLESREA